jgi:hypothetical protein
MQLVGELAVFLGVFGSLIVIIGMITYMASAGHDPGVLKPKYGFLSHVNFIYGGSLLLLCLILKLVVYLVDPSIPIVGPSFLWYRMSSEKGYYDDSFY